MDVAVLEPSDVEITKFSTKKHVDVSVRGQLAHHSIFRTLETVPVLVLEPNAEVHGDWITTLASVSALLEVAANISGSI